jgi:hypothetical protein
MELDPFDEQARWVAGRAAIVPKPATVDNPARTSGLSS